jgi:hypothetical protein
MKFKYFSTFFFILSLTAFSHAQVVTNVATISASITAPIVTPVMPPTVCGIYCTPPLPQPATTTKKVYKLPKEGVRIKFTDANFSIFPDKIINPWADRKIFVVSSKWQTACLYDETGNKYVVKKEDMVATTTTQAFVGKPLCIQTATGKKDLPTEIGLYNIQTKYGKDYKSTFYTTTGDKPEKKEDGAPMPFAMHFGRIIGQYENKKLIFDFSDGSAIHEKQTFNKLGAMPFVSHGCIAVEKGMGQTLQKIVTYGDMVLVIGENIPTTISEMISLNK